MQTFRVRQGLSALGREKVKTKAPLNRPGRPNSAAAGDYNTGGGEGLVLIWAINSTRVSS